MCFWLWLRERQRHLSRGDGGRVRLYAPDALAPSAGPRVTRSAYFGPGDGLVETPVLARGDLAAGPVSGPAIVEEYDSTCVVPPGCRASLGRSGSMIIEVEQAP